MKRLSVAVVVTLAVLVLPAAAAAIPSHHGVKVGAPVVGALAPAGRYLAPHLMSPLYTLTGSATIAVHVYGYAGAPEAGAGVIWMVGTDTDGAIDAGSTDANGLVTFTGVPAASANNGEILVIPPSDTFVYYDIWNLAWADPAGTDLVVRPGQVGLSLQGESDPFWNPYYSAMIVVYSDNGDAHQLAESITAQADPTAPSVVTAASPLALPGNVTDAAVYFWNDEGMEFSLNGLTATAGAPVASGLTLDQAAAQRMYNFSWASGKPGTKTTIKFQNFPAGWQNHLSGYSVAGGAAKDFGTWTSPGGTSWLSKSFTIPLSAKPGFNYDVAADHTTGTLSLAEGFQVCTLNPSKASLAAPGSIRFSGRVPFKQGSRKTVILYKRLTSAGQPGRVGGPTKVSGWKKVTSFKTDTAGKFRSPLVSASRTAWYVLWYPRDNSHWGAWTSVKKVTVH